MSKLGTTKYENSKRNYFSFKKDQNTFILRIIPPYGKLADKGKFSIYHRVEFGYKGTDGKMKPFLSPRVVNRQGMVEQESLAHLRRENLKSQQAQAKNNGDEATAKRLTEMLRTYNQDAKHYMNVVDLQGNVGLFKLGHKGFQALQGKIDKLRAEGVDPIGISTGRFFTFSRSGTGRDTLYTVEEYKKKQQMTGPDGSLVIADVSFNHAIDDLLISKLDTDAFELLDVYPSVTAEEEKLIVEGGPAGVDMVLGKNTNNTTTESSPTGGVETVQPETATNMAEAMGAPVDAPIVQPETATVTTDSTTTVVNTNTGEILKEQPAASVTSTDISQMSDAEFFAQMEAGKLG